MPCPSVKWAMIRFLRFPVSVSSKRMILPFICLIHDSKVIIHILWVYVKGVLKSMPLDDAM